MHMQAFHIPAHSLARRNRLLHRIPDDVSEDLGLDRNNKKKIISPGIKVQMKV